MPLTDIHKKILWEWLCNIVTVAVFGRFIVLLFIQLMNGLQIDIFNVASTTLYTLYLLALIYFLLMRGMPESTSKNFFYWLAAMTGTWASLLISPNPPSQGFSIFLVTQAVGITISLMGLLSLQKSFGLVVANRGIRTGGMYKYIRHPLYAGYIVSTGSYVLMHWSSWNAFILAVHIVAEITRIFLEEKFLSQDPKYVEYKKTTRWRLVPYVW